MPADYIPSDALGPNRGGTPRPPLADWPTVSLFDGLPLLTSSMEGPGAREQQPRQFEAGELHECTSNGAVWRWVHGRWEVVQSAVHDLIPVTGSCPFLPSERCYKATLGLQDASGRRVEFLVWQCEGSTIWKLEVAGAGPAQRAFPTYPAAVCKLRHEAIQIVRAGGMVAGSSGLPLSFANCINDHGRLLRADRRDPYPFPMLRQTERRDAAGNVVGVIFPDDDRARDIIDATLSALAAAGGGFTQLAASSAATAAQVSRASGYESAISAKPPVAPIKAADYWRRAA